METAKSSEQKDEKQASDSLMATVMGPAILDRAIRQAVQHCWIMLPPEKRSAAEVSSEMRRLVDRAIRDLEQDSHAFKSAC